MIRTILATTAVATGLTASAVTASTTLAADDTVVVDVAAVDFSDPAQAEKVYAEVVEASRAVCAEIYLKAPVREVGLATRRHMFTECVKETVDQAVASSENAELSTLHAAADANYAVASK